MTLIHVFDMTYGQDEVNHTLTGYACFICAWKSASLHSLCDYRFRFLEFLTTPLYRVEFKVRVSYCATGVDDKSNSTTWIGSTFYTTLPNAIKVYLKDISLHEYVNGDGAVVDCHCAWLCMESNA
jgi:hypothetical protein